MRVCLDVWGGLGCRWQKAADYQAHGGEIEAPTRLSALSATASAGLGPVCQPSAPVPQPTIDQLPSPPINKQLLTQTTVRDYDQII